MQNRTIQSSLFMLLIIVACPVFVSAADVTGIWKAEFDTQIGLQKYIFILKQDGAEVIGRANSDIEGQKQEVKLKDGKIDGDTITFIEMLTFQGTEIQISYEGTIVGD